MNITCSQSGTELNNYSYLDFDHGNKLMTMGYIFIRVNFYRYVKHL